MFFFVPRVALFLFVSFGAALAWRAWRQRSSPLRTRPLGRGPFSRLPLVPAEILRGADRTWVVFSNPECRTCRALAERLRTAEPDSRVTEVDARREPRLAEAYRVAEVPAVVLANRYGQVEARFIGAPAIEAAIEASTGQRRKPA
jgi:hypothetical protein